MKQLSDEFYDALPDATQTLLIKACLSDKDEALQCWHEWIQQKGYDESTLKKSERLLPQVFDTLDFGSQRMLALVYRRMISLGVETNLINELKGYYRYVWVRNQMLRMQLEEVVQNFTSEGIRHAVIKGFPLLEAYYHDLGVRSTMDLDMIVHAEDWKKALSALSRMNWITKHQQLAPDLLGNTLDHGIHWNKGQGEIDLHFQFLHKPLSTEIENEFWAGMVYYKPLHKMMKPEHQLIGSFEHSYGSVESSIRTIADAVYIIRNNSIDWNEIIRIADKGQLLIPTRMFLHYLNREQLVAVPEVVIQQLGAIPITRQEYRYYQLVIKPAPVNGFKQFRIKQMKARMTTFSLMKRIRLILNTYKFQWGARSIAEFLILLSLALFDKIFHRNRNVEVRKNPFMKTFSRLPS